MQCGNILGQCGNSLTTDVSTIVVQRKEVEKERKQRMGCDRDGLCWSVYARDLLCFAFLSCLSVERDESQQRWRCM